MVLVIVHYQGHANKVVGEKNQVTGIVKLDIKLPRTLRE